MVGPIAIVMSQRTPEEFKQTNPSAFESCRYLSKVAVERNIDLRWIFLDKTFHNGTFDSYWSFTNDGMVEKREPFAPALIVLRLRSELLDKEKRLNDTILSHVCRDKLKTYELFPDSVKKTLLLTPENVQHVKNLATDLIVVKPRYGLEGKNIHIVKKDDITEEFLKKFEEEEYIVQELIDSSKGIGTILKQRHELRVYIFNGRIQSGYLRVPAEGSYLSNISLGAKEKMIDLKDVPESAFDLIKKIDHHFTSIVPRMYCIDIMFEGEKPWIVELNDSPGFPDLGVGQFTIDWHDALLDLFSESVS